MLWLRMREVDCTIISSYPAQPLRAYLPSWLFRIGVWALHFPFKPNILMKPLVCWYFWPLVRWRTINMFTWGCVDEVLLSFESDSSLAMLMFYWPSISQGIIVQRRNQMLAWVDAWGWKWNISSPGLCQRTFMSTPRSHAKINLVLVIPI